MRTLPDPGFPGDDGAADAGLVAALAAHDADPDSGQRWLAALARLQDARLLVPVVATPAGEPDPVTGAEKLTDMAAVLITSRSGSTALLAFSGLGPMAAWDPTARPVPVTARQAAVGAVQNGADTLVVDVAGPVMFVVEGDALVALGRGERLVEVSPGDWGWAQDSR